MNWLGRVRSIDRYWFGDGSYRDLALVRIIVVAGHLLLFYPSLNRQLAYAAAHPDTFLALPALKVLLLPLGGWGIRPDPTLIQAVWVVGVVAGIAGVLGHYTRLSLFTHAAASTLLVAHGYSYGTVHHPPGPLIIALWALAFSRCGHVWSLDQLHGRVRWALARGRFEPLGPGDHRGPFARWPLLLTQWVLALAYLSAGMSKVVAGGIDWFRSSTLSYYLIQDGLRHSTPLGLTVAGYPTLLTIIAIVVVLFELSFVLAVLVPRTAWAYLLAGAGMHAGILLTQGAPFLQWLLLYVVFLPTLRTTWPGSAVLRWLRRRLGSRATRRWAVVYDGYCPLCIRTMVVLDTLDITDRVRPLDIERQWAEAVGAAPTLTREEARHSMHVVTPTGRVHRGFFAFRELTRAIPALWPLAPLMHAPLADALGTRIYAVVARSRARTPCGADGCAIAPGAVVTTGTRPGPSR